MQSSSTSSLKGMGTGMVAGAAAVVVGKVLVKDKHNISKGSAKLIKAMGQIVDGVQTMFK